MVDTSKRKIYKKIKKTKKKVVIWFFLIILFTLVFYYKNIFLEKNRNILWLNHIYQSEVISKFYMVYDDEVINDIDSLILSENLSEERLKSIRKSIDKTKKVAKFRSEYKNNDSLILEEAKNKFKRYKIKENNFSIDLVYFRENNLTPHLKFSSEMCNLEVKSDEQNELEKFSDDVSGCIYTELQKLEGKTIMIGPDHAYTEVLLRIFKRLNPTSKIGVVVFDEHIDVYDTKDANNILGKENVFGKNLVEGRIDKIIFIGVSPDHDNNLSLFFDSYFTNTDLFEKIEFYYDIDYKNFKTSLSKAIKKMEEEGITNIIFSVDVDVLPEEYTGFEYSILAPAMSLAKYYKYYYELPVQHLGSVDFEDPFSRGLTTEEIIDIIKFVKQEAVKYNIKVGFDIYNTTFVGDIEELLPEQDLNFKTTEAAVKIADIMTQ